jgi:hypothetical protein
VQQSDTLVSRMAFRDAIRQDLTVALKEAEVVADPGFDGAPVLTIPALEKALDLVFTVPLAAPDEHHAEVSTPATVIVAAICPRCDIPASVLVELSATLVVDSPHHAEIKVAAKSKAKTHVCGQAELPVSAGDEAEGQTTISDLLDADDQAGEETPAETIGGVGVCTKTRGCARADGHRGLCRDADGAKLTTEEA